MTLCPVLQQVLASLAVVTLLQVHAVADITSLPGSHSFNVSSDGASPVLNLQQPGPRPPRRVGNLNEKAWEKLKKQIKMLNKLGCKPKNTKVEVRQFMEDSKILDYDLYPEVVLVKRCVDVCSYCGNPIGLEDKVCKPKLPEKKKTFLIFYHSRRDEGIHKVRIPVHRACECR